MRLLLKLAVFLMLGVGIILEALQLFYDFPRTYAWTEMMLNYAGGFVRRGLFGQIALALDPLVSVQLLVPIVLSVIYFLIAGYLIFGLCVAESFGGLMFLLSPVGMLFPLLDVPAFARKDAFIVAAFCIAITIARRFKSSPFRSLIAVAAAYTAFQFLIETVWFYFPLAILISLYLSRAATTVRWRITAGAAALSYSAIWMVVQYYAGIGANLDAITKAWQAVYPAAPSTGAVGFVNIGLVRTLGMSWGVWRDRSLRFEYLVAWLLAAAPLLMLVADARPRAASLRDGWLLLLTAAPPSGGSADRACRRLGAVHLPDDDAGLPHLVYPLRGRRRSGAGGPALARGCAAVAARAAAVALCGDLERRPLDARRPPGPSPGHPLLVRRGARA